MLLSFSHYALAMLLDPIHSSVSRGKREALAGQQHATYPDRQTGILDTTPTGNGSTPPQKGLWIRSRCTPWDGGTNAMLKWLSFSSDGDDLSAGTTAKRGLDQI